MTKIILVFILLLIPTFYTDAQSINIITGKVTEFQTNEPMQFVNVILYNQPDSMQVQGTITDVNGDFKFNNVAKGSYYVKTSFIGFEDNYTDKFFHDGNRTDLNVITIHNSAVFLDEINIIGEKSTLTSTLDKRIFSVGKDLISESGSVSDILQHIPSLTVDIDGTITLRGTSNITFLMNGRPSALLRRNAASALQQIPASTIERIEIITNPSAKFKPDGTGGIINIVQQKETGNGTNGQIHANIGNESRFNSGISFNYGYQPFNTFLSYSLRHSGRTIIRSEERTHKDFVNGNILDFYNENGKSKSNPWAHIANAGLNYELNDNNNIELSGNYFLQNTSHEGSTDIRKIDAGFQPVNLFQSVRTNDESEKEGEIGALFEHKFDEEGDHNITTEINFASSDEKEDQIYKEIYAYPEVSTSIERQLIKKSENQTEIKSEYVLPVNEENEFEAGIITELNNADIRYNDFINPNRFQYKQNIYAAYSIYKGNLGEFGFQLGLRGEQAMINSRLVEPVDSSIDNNYFKLYPTVHLAYKLTDNQNIKISYSKRVNRPDADELNPFPEFHDPRNAEAGNPHLKPEEIHSIEMTYQLTSGSVIFTPSLYYRYKYNAFTSIRKYKPNGITIYTIENLASRKSGGIELILSGNLFEILELDLSSNFFFDQIDATNLGYGRKKDIFSVDSKLNSLCRITDKTYLQLNFHFGSPTITPQGEREQTFLINAGIKQKLFNNKLDLVFTVSDLLDLYRSRWEINTRELKQITNRHIKEPLYYLGINWYFGKNNKEENKLQFENEKL